MATQPMYDKPVSVDEYLSMAFEHDCEYVDGIIEERDLGEFEHAYVQGILIGLFLKNREQWGVYPLPEQRVQTRKTHFRVPDITVLCEGTKREGILTHPPLLVIEVQSPDVPMRRTTIKAAEYRAF
jgi:Uma2 family endonuclease